LGILGFRLNSFPEDYCNLAKGAPDGFSLLAIFGFLGIYQWCSDLDDKSCKANQLELADRYNAIRPPTLLTEETGNSWNGLSWCLAYFLGVACGPSILIVFPFLPKDLILDFQPDNPTK